MKVIAKAIRVRLLTIALAGTISGITLFGGTSCREYATGSDKETIARLQRTWGSKYNFKLTSDTYWKARLKSNVPYNEGELRVILDEFTAGRTDSGFVYMNVYDAKGRFVVQFYRGTDGVIKKSNAEYY
jgi:hypothetical protein